MKRVKNGQLLLHIGDGVIIPQREIYILSHWRRTATVGSLAIAISQVFLRNTITIKFSYPIAAYARRAVFIVVVVAVCLHDLSHHIYMLAFSAT